MPTIRTALKAECLVDALCQDCDHCQRLNLLELAARGYQNVPLIELLLVCATSLGRSLPITTPNFEIKGGCLPLRRIDTIAAFENGQHTERTDCTYIGGQ